MIPLEQLRESSFYQFIIEEGLKEGRKEGLKQGIKEGIKEGLEEGKEVALAELLQMLIAKKFPKLNVPEKARRIHDVKLLKQLCLEVNEWPNAATARRRLAEVADIRT